MEQTTTHWLFSRPAVARIVSDVCKQDSVKLDALVGHSKARKLSRLRHFIWWRIHRELHIGAHSIGQAFDRDRTTVRDGMMAHEKRVAHEPQA